MNYDIIDALSSLVYTEENKERASRYLAGRGLNFNSLRFPWIMTGNDVSPFYSLKDYYPPEIFVDCLYVPITDIQHSNSLVGFDVRYCGNLEHRIRYTKKKRTGDTILMYYSKPLDQIGTDEPVIITEGAIDGETVHQCTGYTVISPLSKIHHFRFCVFLRAITSKIFIMYDNDTDGAKSVKHIAENTAISQMNVASSFKSIIYSGPDPNKSLMTNGYNYLKNIIDSQVKPFI